jgi:hypothetical protein
MQRTTIINPILYNLIPYPEHFSAAELMSCDFENVSNNCYFISSERVGWIEAKKKCEMKDAQLLSLSHKVKEEDLLEFVSGITKRRRAKYWNGKNNVSKEGKWENCLLWSSSFGFNIGDSDSNWQGARA